jgi:hypothetical protein
VSIVNEKSQEPKKTVWIACRATEGCNGNLAIIEQTFDHLLSNGQNSINSGVSIRYVCQTCGRAFHVTR